MQINSTDLRDKLIMNINYHDSKILKVTKKNNNITIMLKDDYQPHINELIFVNSEINSQNDLEGRIIYQFEDLVKFDQSKWHMSLLIWAKEEDLLEKINIEAENIIAKKYTIKKDILDSFPSPEELLDTVTKRFGELNTESLLNKDLVSFIDNKYNERETLLSDFNNYTLIEEESLNKIIND